MRPKSVGRERKRDTGREKEDLFLLHNEKIYERITFVLLFLHKKMLSSLFEIDIITDVKVAKLTLALSLRPPSEPTSVTSCLRCRRLGALAVNCSRGSFRPPRDTGTLGGKNYFKVTLFEYC